MTYCARRIILQLEKKIFLLLVEDILVLFDLVNQHLGMEDGETAVVHP